ELVACVDKMSDKANYLASKFPGAKTFSDWREIMSNKEIDIIIIATPHMALAEITRAAVEVNKHVLVEKPAAKFAHELVEIIKQNKQSKSLVRVGFNHRYHRAFRQAKKMVNENALGELMFVRARYGHGGRVGYDKEWRARPEISGGGELIDQGVHLIDLARWFLGDFTDIQGHAHTYFWQMPVDDNGFMLLKTPKKQTAFLHASCTEWKNTFSFEIYGQQGKIDINGLGGSYGIERLSYYKMSPAMGPPETFIWEYPMEDDSWEVEFKEFLEDIKHQRQPAAGLHDAYAALKIVEKIYKDSGYDSSA
ncbi:MAG: Gfo/Idh/MocA family oxidoreductase, partial [Gammaproteobacteria bacterium]